MTSDLCNKRAIKHNPRDRAVGSDLVCTEKKKNIYEKKGKRKLEMSDTDFYNLRAALCSPT